MVSKFKNYQGLTDHIPSDGSDKLAQNVIFLPEANGITPLGNVVKVDFKTPSGEKVHLFQGATHVVLNQDYKLVLPEKISIEGKAPTSFSSYFPKGTKVDFLVLGEITIMGEKKALFEYQKYLLETQPTTEQLREKLGNDNSLLQVITAYDPQRQAAVTPKSVFVVPTPFSASVGSHMLWLGIEAEAADKTHLGPGTSGSAVFMKSCRPNGKNIQCEDAGNIPGVSSGSFSDPEDIKNILSNKELSKYLMRRLHTDAAGVERIVSNNGFRGSIFLTKELVQTGKILHPGDRVNGSLPELQSRGRQSSVTPLKKPPLASNASVVLAEP